MTIMTVRRRRDTQAVQWLGTEASEAEVRELTTDFRWLYDEDREHCGDPEATGTLLAAPHSEHVLVYDTDWIVARPGGGFVRMTDEEFVAEYEPVAR